MSIEFIGFVNTREFSEIHPQKGEVMDLAYIETVAKAHEYAGFDRALVAFHSTSPESLLIAQHALSVTRRLGMMIAHRPESLALCDSVLTLENGRFTGEPSPRAAEAVASHA